MQVRSVVSRRTSEDSVVVVREHLRFLQPLVTSRRAPDKVRVSGRLAIEHFDQRFRRDRHLVRRTRTEVQELLGMTHDCAAVAPGRRRSSHVGLRCRKARAERRCKRRIVNRAGISAAAEPFIASAPARERHPDFDADARIRRRRHYQRDPAKIGQSCDHRACRWREGAPGDGLRDRNRCERDRDAGEAFACCPRRGTRCETCAGEHVRGRRAEC